MLVPRTDELITKSRLCAACITTSQKWGNSTGNDVFLYPLRDATPSSKVILTCAVGQVQIIPQVAPVWVKKTKGPS